MKSSRSKFFQPSALTETESASADAQAAGTEQQLPKSIPELTQIIQSSSSSEEIVPYLENLHQICSMPVNQRQLTELYEMFKALASKNYVEVAPILRNQVLHFNYVMIHAVRQCDRPCVDLLILCGDWVTSTSIWEALEPLGGKSEVESDRLEIIRTLLLHHAKIKDYLSDGNQASQGPRYDGKQLRTILDTLPDLSYPNYPREVLDLLTCKDELDRIVARLAPLKELKKGMRLPTQEPDYASSAPEFFADCLIHYLSTAPEDFKWRDHLEGFLSTEDVEKLRLATAAVKKQASSSSASSDEPASATSSTTLTTGR